MFRQVSIRNCVYYVSAGIPARVSFAVRCNDLTPEVNGVSRVH